MAEAITGKLVTVFCEHVSENPLSPKVHLPIAGYKITVCEPCAKQAQAVAQHIKSVIGENFPHRD